MTIRVTNHGTGWILFLSILVLGAVGCVGTGEAPGGARAAEEPAAVELPPTGESAPPPARAADTGRDLAGPPRRERHFEFVYRAAAAAPEGAFRLNLWIPIARTDDHQAVRRTSTTVKIAGREVTVGGSEAYLTAEPAFSNRALRVTSRGEPIEVEVRYDVTRLEYVVRDLFDGSAPPLSEEERRFFEPHLAPDALVPIDGVIAERARRIVGAETRPAVQARRLYDAVLADMTYDKSRPGWGRGDAVWACGSGFGNCTDFHSLFIGMARSLGIPARFFMGFSIPSERGEGTIEGYHCWASFYVSEHGWIPIDLSEADRHPELAEYYFGGWTEDRVAFAEGRDLVLPWQEEKTPLNFFLAPYLEVDGLRSDERVAAEYRYRDLDVSMP